jgi:class 3 adenylate cyclase
LNGVVVPLGDIATHPRCRFTCSILFVLDVESCISSLSYPMTHRPTGNVSFVFTDIEGSVALWEQRPEAMRLALARHDAVLREVIGAHSSYAGNWVMTV